MINGKTVKEEEHGYQKLQIIHFIIVSKNIINIFHLYILLIFNFN